MMVRLFSAVLCVLLLAGCGAGRPGAAAVVDGTTIPMTDVDRAADVFCSLSLLQAQQQGVTAISSAEIRRQAVAELVLAEVADEIAERESLRIRGSDVRMGAAERRQAAQSLPDVDLDAVVSVIEASRRTFAIAEALGARAAGQDAGEAEAEALQQAGRAELAAAVDEADVEFDPRFGLGAGGEQVATSGSLSVTSVDLAGVAPEQLPATQRCA